MKKAFLLGILCVFLLTASATKVWADSQRIAVISDGNTTSSAVSAVAARGPYFLIFDGNGAFIEAISNPHKNVGGGASSLVIDFLSGKGAATIIAGTFGDKMVAAMKAKNIKHLEFKGTAEAAIKKFVH